MKKAIELSRLCDQRIFMIIYDQDRDKAIQFTSDKDFGFQEAYMTARRIRKSSNPANLEIVDNTDYGKFELAQGSGKEKRDPNDPVPGLDDANIDFSDAEGPPEAKAAEAAVNINLNENNSASKT